MVGHFITSIAGISLSVYANGSTCEKHGPSYASHLSYLHKVDRQARDREFQPISLLPLDAPPSSNLTSAATLSSSTGLGLAGDRIGDVDAGAGQGGELILVTGFLDRRDGILKSLACRRGTGYT